MPAGPGLVPDLVVEHGAEGVDDELIEADTGRLRGDEDLDTVVEPESAVALVDRRHDRIHIGLVGVDREEDSLFVKRYLEPRLDGCDGIGLVHQPE